jgi:predicted AlkP superfamily pyrophosphatase or phosphodiesterase
LDVVKKQRVDVKSALSLYKRNEQQRSICMKEKVILILVDGMTSESVESCSHTFIKKVLKDYTGNLYSTTVMPSVTLPCHMSLFHSVPPQRHGILTNTYVPQVRPVEGLMEQLKKHNKSSAFFYNWEQLRDLSQPGSLAHSCYISMYQYERSDNLLTDRAIQYISEFSPDFIFLYLGETDEIGHKYGWMSKEYQRQVFEAWNCIENVFRAADNTYNIIVTADHGGHDFMHGTDDPRDMNIPIIISGTSKNATTDKMDSAGIMDIAPTITTLMGIKENESWQGTSLIN